MKVSAAEAEEMRLVTTRGVGDAPLPVKYEAAKQALAECSSVDECSTWAKKAAALASYARQADDRSLEDMAARIRARAIKRCGELLREVKPTPGKRTDLKPTTGTDSRFEVAKQAGMSQRQAIDALRVSRIPAAEFEAAVESANPPTITELAERGTRKAAPLIDLHGRDPAKFNRSLLVAGRISDLAADIANLSAKDMAAGCLPRQVKPLLTNATALSDWLANLVAELEST